LSKTGKLQTCPTLDSPEVGAILLEKDN